MLRLTSKDEDYLETIYRISKSNDTVGVTDVAKARKVTVPTARAAVAKLIKSNLVSQQHYGKIMLKEKGREIAVRIYEVHKTIFRFLTEVLWIDQENAEKEACRMEHGLSKETLKRLVLFLDAIDDCNTNSHGCIGIYRQSVNEKES